MHRQTKETKITAAVKCRVWERDGGCIICRRPGSPDAHFISRAQGGKGVEQNIVTLCRECHTKYDQSEERREIRDMIQSYLISKYPGWDEADLVYRKG